MKHLLTASVLSLALLPLAAGAHGHRHYYPTVTTAAPIQITVSCARYISTKVIWDRPQGIFLEDLARAGYSQERAWAIGNRICRDERLVGNEAAMGAAMRQILRNSPPGS